ncbi:hypothetical protein GGH12_000765 [Coemansia sp. RSA 1822]|nr:hypothetical protein LPJ76_001632 [Coemansia sp. RSA 638]KAJ2544927.1 hypothetical protein GGF49_000837 [Coemansia sp. RSA 1853]KAJ2566611.1 hypothetical protein GGH12_000765 [Coemansia sp. RSA 1822]
MADSQASAYQDSAQPVVLITRVGSWIGAEAAVHFLKRGVTVIGVGSNPDRISELTSALAKMSHNTGKFIPCVGVLTSPELQDQIVEHIKSEGQLIAFVHNVGAYEPPNVQASEPIEQWEALQRSLLEALPMAHRVRALLRKQKGRVVNVASDDALTELPNHVALVAIKTAVNMLTAELALVEPSITSLAVHPGIRLPFASTSASHPPSTDQLQPAGELIVDLALNAKHSMSGQFFMYSEPDFLKSSKP